MYDSWKSRMELYMMNRQHGRMILESVENAIQADSDIKATNIILQGLPPEVYALVSNHKVAKKLWERIQLLMQGTSLTKQEDSSQQYSSNQSSTPLSITYPSNDYQSSVHHNAYSPPSSIPQIEYAPTVNQQQQQPEFPPLYLGLTVLVFKQGEGHMSKQCTKPKSKQDDSWFKDKVLLHSDTDCDELNTVKVSLMANLSHYGLDALAEVHNPNVDTNIINQAVQAMPSSGQSNVVNHLETEIKPVIAKSSLFKKAQQLEPKLYDGNVIEKTNAIVILDSEETLMLAEESRSKMILKPKDLIMLEKKVNTTPVDYAVLNQLSQFFETRFVPQTELSAEQAFWSQNSMNSPEPTLSSRPTKVEVPKELPKVSMVNTSLKKLKHHLAGFDVVVKQRTTPQLITECSRITAFRQYKKKDKIQQTPSSTQKNKVEAHHRKVKSSLKNKDCVVAPKGTANVQHSKLNANSKLKCVKCNGCMLSNNHDLCVLDFINNVNARVKSKYIKKSLKRKVWKPTGKVFTNIR
ncbi:hypothetical protein Tco_0652039 [Tanacetum coccineum]|uniref:Uncharacterized protein n=1 Tax=Tanacetum coccineum TaxID=301880 RepID=A0ABQ4WWQ5_9ASTR